MKNRYNETARSAGAVARTALCLALVLAACLTLASCGNKKLYASLEGLWCVDDASIVVKFTEDSDGVRTVSIIDSSLEVAGVGGYYTIDGDVLVINSTSAEYIGGEGRNATVPFSYDKAEGVLTLEYNGKTVRLLKWSVDLGTYSDASKNTDADPESAAG